MIPIPKAAIDAATLALHESICEGPLESCPLAPEHAEFATRMLFAAEEAWPHQPPKRDLTGTTNGQFDRGPVASPYRRHGRLQALVAAGWSQAKLGRRLGVLPSNFGALLRGARITAATGWAVAALYDELWDRRPPQAAHREKIAANRARNYAAARGWPPPAAWDDETIGDPLAGPAEGWQRSARRTLRAADVVEDAAELAAQGYTREQAAERLGISRAALDRALVRARPAAGEAA